MSTTDERVRQVLKTLSKSRTFLAKARHEALSDFGQWLFEKKPHFDEETMRLLLVGNGRNDFPEGLFHVCGTIKENEDKNNGSGVANISSTSVAMEPSHSFHGGIPGSNKRFKQSATVALEILSQLAFPTEHVLPHQTSQHFKDIVTNLDYDTLLKAKLDLHLMNQKTMDFAARILTYVFEHHVDKEKDMNPNHVLIDKSSKDRYLAWYEKIYGHEFGESESKKNENDGKDGDDEKGNGLFGALGKQSVEEWIANQPKSWNDVNVETFNQIEEGGEEWQSLFDSLTAQRARAARKQTSASDGGTAFDDFDIGLAGNLSSEFENDQIQRKSMANSLLSVNGSLTSAEKEAFINNLKAFSDPLGQLDARTIRNLLQQYYRRKFDFESISQTNSNTGGKNSYYAKSPDVKSENFDATPFLVELHGETDFDLLVNGLANINRVVEDQSHQMRKLVAENFDQFVYCKDTIDRIHALMRYDEELNKKQQQSGMIDHMPNIVVQQTRHVSDRLDSLEHIASELYAPLLKRTNEAKKIGDTLNLIKQPSMQFLFTLIQNIEENITMHNFDSVVRLYKRARVIENEVRSNPLLKMIFEKVQSIISELRNNLLKKLEHSTHFTEEEERIIHYLMDLDCEKDPAMLFFRQRYEMINRKLKECVQKYNDEKFKLTAYNSVINGSQTGLAAVSVAVNTAIENDIKFDGASSSSASSLSSKKMNVSNLQFVQKKTIQQMCRIFNHYIPDFWKLGKAIIDGKFKKDEDSFENSKLLHAHHPTTMRASMLMANENINSRLHNKSMYGINNNNTNNNNNNHQHKKSALFIQQQTKNQKRVKDYFEKLTMQFRNQIESVLEEFNENDDHSHNNNGNSNHNNSNNNGRAASESSSHGSHNYGFHSHRRYPSTLKYDEIVHRRNDTIETGKENVRHLLDSYREMKSMRIPEEYLFNVDKLISDVTRDFLHKLFRWTLDNVSKFAFRERWRPHREISGITTLPLAFESLISDTLRTVDEIGIGILYDADEQFVQYLANKRKRDFQSIGNEMKLNDDNNNDDLLLDDVNGNNNNNNNMDGIGSIENNTTLGVNNNNNNNNNNFDNASFDSDNDVDLMSDDGLMAEVLDSGKNRYELNALWIVPLIGSFFMEAFKSFADCLHYLVYPESVSKKEFLYGERDKGSNRHESKEDDHNHNGSNHDDGARRSRNESGIGDALAAGSSKMSNNMSTHNLGSSHRQHSGTNSSSSSSGSTDENYGLLETLLENKENSDDKKLLFILGNCIYTRDIIFERLWNQFLCKNNFLSNMNTTGASGLQYVNNIYKSRHYYNLISIEYQSLLDISFKSEIIDLYSILHEMIFNRYVRSKTLKLNGIINESLLCDGINWEYCPKPVTIRNHCLQLLLNFVFVHNTVYNSSKSELDNVLKCLIERVSDHMLIVLKMIDKFNVNGAMQILTEIEFIRDVLDKYLLKHSSLNNFNEMRQLLYEAILNSNEDSPNYNNSNNNSNNNCDTTIVSIFNFQNSASGKIDREWINQTCQALMKATKQSTVVMFSCFTQPFTKQHARSRSNRYGMNNKRRDSLNNTNDINTDSDVGHVSDN